MRRELPPLRSVWDVAHVRSAFDDANIKPGHLKAVLGWLSRHPAVIDWPGVDWSGVLQSVPHRARNLLREKYVVRSTTVESATLSMDLTTTKLVVKLFDDRRVETVVMRHGTLRSQRITVCVSSQVGCQMNCSFCATGTMGLRGDLSAGEIVEQFAAARAIEPLARNVVFMGMGEPLNNYDAVLATCAALLDGETWGLRAGGVTVSTVGISHRIRQLARDEPRVNLALSLHAPTQAKRIAIMPAAQAFGLPQLLSSMEAYVAAKLQAGNARVRTKETHPLVMVEYILLGGVNDTDEDAHELGKLLKPPALAGRAMVNLIAYNPVEGLPYDRPAEGQVRSFQQIVKSYGILTCVRVTMGLDIAGACGQLAKDITAQKDGEKKDGVKARALNIEDDPFSAAEAASSKPRRRIVLENGAAGLAHRKGPSTARRRGGSPAESDAAEADAAAAPATETAPAASLARRAGMWVVVLLVFAGLLSIGFGVTELFSGRA
ncbi:hypothetical protein M885DRAFT_616433 [Pelagophyceae sp. CCMP2097]|nr:hypothetical protein M885DRAFT_616433 [Pelagophyceae sp. CCMP2097]